MAENLVSYRKEIYHDITKKSILSKLNNKCNVLPTETPTRYVVQLENLEK